MATSVTIYNDGTLYGDADAIYGRISSGLLSAQAQKTRETGLKVSLINEQTNLWDQVVPDTTGIFPADSGYPDTGTPLSFTYRYWRGQAAAVKLDDDSIVRVRIGSHADVNDRQIWVQTITDPTDVSQWESWAVLYSGDHYAIAIVQTGATTYDVYHTRSGGFYINNTLKWATATDGQSMAYAIRINPAIGQYDYVKGGDTLNRVVFFGVLKEDTLEGLGLGYWDIYATGDVINDQPVRQDSVNLKWSQNALVAIQREEAPDRLAFFNVFPYLQDPRVQDRGSSITVRDASGWVLDYFNQEPILIRGLAGKGGHNRLSECRPFKCSDGYYYNFYSESHLDSFYEANSPSWSGYGAWQRSKDLIHWSEPTLMPINEGPQSGPPPPEETIVYTEVQKRFNIASDALVSWRSDAGFSLGAGRDPHNPLGRGGTSPYYIRSLMRFALDWSDVKEVVKAEIYLYRTNYHGILRTPNFYIKRNTSTWSEGTVGGPEPPTNIWTSANAVHWNNKPSTTSADHLHVAYTTSGWYKYDITALVKQWGNIGAFPGAGGQPNHGITLKQTSSDSGSPDENGSMFVEFASKESAYAPYILLTYKKGTASTAPTVTTFHFTPYSIFEREIDSINYLYIVGNGPVYRRPIHTLATELDDYVTELEFEIPRENQEGSGSVTVANPGGINDHIQELNDRRIKIELGLKTSNGEYEFGQLDDFWVKQIRREDSGAKSQLIIELGNIWTRLSTVLRDTFNIIGKTEYVDFDVDRTNQPFNYFFTGGAAGTAIASNNRMQVSPGGTVLWTGWKGQNPDFTVRFYSYTVPISILFRYIDANNYYELELTNNTTLTLKRIRNGSPSTLTTFNITGHAELSTGSQRFGVYVNNKYIRPYVGHTLFGSFHLDSPDPLLKPGYVGFKSTNAFQVSQFEFADYEYDWKGSDLVKFAAAMVDYHDVSYGGPDQKQYALVWGPQTDIPTPGDGLRQVLEAEKSDLIWADNRIIVGQFKAVAIERILEDEILETTLIKEVDRRVNLAIVDGNEHTWMEPDLVDIRTRDRQIVAYFDLPELLTKDAVEQRAKEEITLAKRGESPGGVIPVLFDLWRMDPITWIDNLGRSYNVRVEGIRVEVKQGEKPKQTEELDLSLLP